MNYLKGKTQSTQRIKQNRDLALWRDITQTNTRKYPKGGLYLRVINYMEGNYIFKPGDLDIVKKRYGESKGYKQIQQELEIADGCRHKLLRILKELSHNRRAYTDGEFKEDSSYHKFDKGYWNGRKIKNMNNTYLNKAKGYAQKTNQPDKVAELDKEIQRRNTSTEKQGDDYILKARLKLAFLMAKEENEEIKNEYFNILKDLRKGE